MHTNGIAKYKRQNAITKVKWNGRHSPNHYQEKFIKEQSVPPDYSTREISHIMQSMIDRLKRSRKTELVDTN